ncbi:endonuclease domain-containing protein [Streptomyces sp. TLI_105]|uniref:endonuclease domain-containing protein n=1 Tax=Streptomyces sp. TLI_105 TaxID=1881019 RepID=UPI000B83A87C|nr:endonuclease domain-containing protein [Streptomyces sp. TLI_105]
MSGHVIPGRAGDLIRVQAADALWADLTADSAVPTASTVFVSPPVSVRAGYVLLGSRVVMTVKAGDGRWSVSESEVRQAAAELCAIQVDLEDLVRIGPFGGVPKQEPGGGVLLGWRRRIVRELQEPTLPGQAVRDEGVRTVHLAGLDWRRILVEQDRDRAGRTWWLPRSVVRALDAAEHAERRWLQTARTGPETAGPTRPRPPRRQTPPGSRQTTRPDPPAARLRPYNEELKGLLYSVLSRKPDTSRKVAGWICAVCHTAPAAVLDHCHEHGYVRAPLCQSCNTQERPDHLYPNDIRVTDRYTRLFTTHAHHWLHHWHRCPGCRTRTTLPLPHLAAWTAHTACCPLRPTHRDTHSSRGRKPCGTLRVSWTGSHHAPHTCLLTIKVDFCPSGEHRDLAQIPYRQAAEQFRIWLAETAPTVAAAAGPDRLDDLPTQFRPVIADTSKEDQGLF